MKAFVERLYTERRDQTQANGWQLTIELFGLVISFGVAR